MKQTVATGATVEQAVSNALNELGLAREEVVIDVIDEGKKGFFGFGAKDAKVRVSAVFDIAASDPDPVPSGTEKDAAEEQSPMIAKHETVDPDIPELSDDSGDEAKGPVIPVVPTEPLEPVRPDEQDEPDGDGPGEEIRRLDEAIEETADYLKAVASEMGAKDVHVFHMLDGKNLEFRLESPDAALLIGKRGQTLNALQQLVQVVANNKAKQFLLVSVDAGDYRARRKETLEELAERKADQAVRTGQRIALEPMPAGERKIIHNALSERFDVDTRSEGREPHRHLVIEPHK
ncbi:RNA-binding cell elongation regulator Jag/EloR [Bhargavaea cecembensis]|uniref:RNA-binding cell elongation regulator Jag/EloR n=1 Tax=Bhargavaea cecembensis TaxID=394098 RepID=UPI00058C565A|nr:RNA-binding cell elongation regulator Jag/EloR [Bhargavaea cecembensis]